LLPRTECLHWNLVATVDGSYTVSEFEGREDEEKSQFSSFIDLQLNSTVEPTSTTFAWDNE